jgi:hypothetical protein
LIGSSREAFQAGCRLASTATPITSRATVTTWAMAIVGAITRSCCWPNPKCGRQSLIA